MSSKSILARIVVLSLAASSIGCYRTASSLPTYDVRAFGAKGDGATKDTAAIQAAFDAATKSDGGIIRVPIGRYVCGSLFMRANHTTLQLDAGAVILGSEEQADYPITRNRWEGIEREGHAALLNAHNLRDIAITGKGAIDGRGKVWWDWQRKKQLKQPRPRLVQLIECRDVRIDGVTLQNSPAWTLHPLYCKDVTIDGLTILAPEDSPNTDGIDPDSCERVRITNCRIDVGDDCIAIKCGKDEDGRRVGRPSKNITVENCRFIHGHGGVVIGSEMSGGVRHVRVNNCIYEGTDRGVRIKTQRGRGGTVEDIVYENLTMRNVGDAVNIDMFYSGRPTTRPEKIGAGTPTFRDIHLVNIRAEGVKVAGRIMGLPERPVRDLVFKNVTIQAEKGMQVQYVEESDFRGLAIEAATGEAMKAERVEAKGLPAK